MTRTSAIAAGALALTVVLTAAPPAAAQDSAPRPLSAIDWLDRMAREAPQTGTQPPLNEPPVAGAVTIPEVETTALGEATSAAVGLLPPSVTGLPPDLWVASDTADLIALWRGAGAQPYPAIQALYHTLLLAEAEPPRRADGAFLRTRVATLRRFGAVEPALELLERAGPKDARLFAEWFDLALLHGAETEACTALRDRPSLMADDAAEIYCTALTGDWRTAALIFDSAQALGLMDGARGALLAQFLDPELAEAAAELAPMAAPTPLDFRLYEAIGTPLPTRGLPLAFAMSDLRGTVGWKAEIEAAERLTRAGALAPNRLMGLYTRQSPAASGGVWDRVQAVQALDAALNGANGAQSAAALQDAWAQMRAEGLEMPFAQIFSDRLRRARLPDGARALAFRIALLTPDYESAAASAPPGMEFLASLAQGRPDAAKAGTTTEQMIAAAFAPPPGPAPEHALLIRQGKLGEAILAAALKFDRASGDPGEMAAALRTLRAVGLEDTARRAALQALILQRSE